MLIGPVLRTVGFWGSFYVFTSYSGKDPATSKYRYPSYLILKEQIILETWEKGFNGETFQKQLHTFA